MAVHDDVGLLIHAADEVTGIALNLNPRRNGDTDGDVVLPVGIENSQMRDLAIVRL